MAREKTENLVQGTVVETLPSAMFRVRIAPQTSEEGAVNPEILAYLSGKMRIHYIKVLPGDTVLMKMSPDGKRGIIMRRI
jgi:translation initiation factor IF-1